jgi:hypothetical protein
MGLLELPGKNCKVLCHWKKLMTDSSMLPKPANDFPVHHVGPEEEGNSTNFRNVGWKMLGCFWSWKVGQP